MTDQTYFVQFPHPGPEHAPKSDAMDWNRGDHKRKFMRASGRFVHDDVIHDGEFTLWGEWEPPSRIVKRFVKPGAGMPRVVHKPLLNEPHEGSWRQNTDPFVFGEHMLYSNCRQQQNRKLRSLAPGSVIIFGSKLAGDFVLDTLFVVAASAAFTVGNSAELEWTEAERLAVVDPLGLDGNLTGLRFRRYEGVTRAQSASRLFSYVPCRPWDERGAPFRRPSIRLDPTWITPRLTQNVRATPASSSQLAALWETVTQQVVEDHGLCLAVHVHCPPVGAEPGEDP